MKKIKIISMSLIVLWAVILLFLAYLFTTKIILNSEKIDQLRKRETLTQLCAKMVSASDIDYLISIAPDDYDKEYDKQIHQNETFVNICNRLGLVQNEFSKEIGDIYIVIEKNGGAQILADGNVDSCTFGQILDYSEWPVMKKALAEKTSKSELEFYWDKDLKKWSTSTYSVIRDEKGNFKAIVGADFFMEDWNVFKIKYIFYSVVMSLSIMLLGFFVPLLSFGFVKIVFFPKIDIK